MTRENCHVRPLAPDTEPPPPTVHIRNKDLVRYRALLVGYEAVQKALAKDPQGVLTFDAWSRAFGVTLDYLRTRDRRRSALDEVL
jgi:hypothetical protein